MEASAILRTPTYEVVAPCPSRAVSAGRAAVVVAVVEAVVVAAAASRSEAVGVPEGRVAAIKGAEMAEEMIGILTLIPLLLDNLTPQGAKENAQLNRCELRSSQPIWCFVLSQAYIVSFVVL